MTKRTWTLALALVFLVGMALAQAALDNDSVVKMSKAGLGEDVIVSMVNGQPGHYNTTPDAIIQLKQAGVSNKIINAMVTRASGGAPPVAAAPAAPAAPMVDEIGVYYRKDDKWVQLLPEIVNWKTGGFLKSIASQGVVKGDVNGHIEGKSAKLSVTTPLDFLIYTPDGTAVTEYLLLRLRPSGNAREFRSTTGGVVHSSGGAERDEVDFGDTATKIAPRTYEIKLGQEFKNGEYGFLPPGATSSSNMASSGKIYSFHVLE
jgi:hypothetical protein